MTEEKKNKEGQSLVKEAMDAYGIRPDDVLKSRIDRAAGAAGQAVIVTHGGKKVRYARGEKVEPLTEIERKGINPDWAKRKPIAGKKRED